MIDYDFKIPVTSVPKVLETLVAVFKKRPVFCRATNDNRFDRNIANKVSRFYLAFCPWGLESEVTFAHDIPYEQVHEFY